MIAGVGTENYIFVSLVTFSESNIL